MSSCNLFLERFLEFLLKRKETPLTPDRIRYALSKVHTISFEEPRTQKTGKMRSSLSEDTAIIFNTLGISLERTMLF